MDKEAPAGSFFQIQRNRLLAALYEEDAAGAGQIYQRILDQAGSLGPDLRENDEKALRQIQVILKRFPRTLPRKEYARLRGLLSRITRDQTKQVRMVEYSTWAGNLNLLSWQEKRLFETAVTFQMTKGCSHFCRRCNEWALPGVRAHFSKEAVLRFLEKLNDRKNFDLALYGASDPLDWEDPPHEFIDLFSQKTIRYSILTKAPRGKLSQVKELIRKKIPFSLSLTARNRKKIQTLEKKMNSSLPRHHDLDDLLIPAGLDEDFISVKPSITDAYGSEITPEGAFIIIPTFTSALHPLGHEKIPVCRQTLFFPARHLGRMALLRDYFKPLPVVGKNPEPFFIDHLLGVQVESILLDSGKEELTPPGMRSIKEYFEIFEDRARIKRKKMTRSVVRKLKQEFLGNKRYSALSPALKKEYRSRIRSHLNFTRRNPVMKARISAASFFLAQVRTYLPAHPVETRIIAFLTRDEYEKRKPSGQGPWPSLLTGFADPDRDAWRIFRFHALFLVHENDPAPIDRFIADWPARYDPDQDGFVPEQDL